MSLPAMPPSPPHHRSPDRSRAGGGDAVLWASACVLAAFVVIQAGRPVSEGGSTDASAAALAAQSGTVDGFSIVAGRSGRGDDADPTKIVWVIDSAAEAVMVYEVEDARRNAITFREGSSLPRLFESARR